MTAGAEFSQTNVESIAPEGDGWKVKTGEGELTARAIIIATGTALKHLGVPGEEKFTGNGVSHCATCDGPLLKNKVAVVAGGGDSAMQEALTLSQFVSQVVIVNKAGELTGQASYQQLVGENAKIEVRNNATVEEIVGDAAVTAVRVASGGSKAEVPASGVFVFVGLKPETKFLEGFVKLDADGGVETDGAMRTELKGIAAAGTVRSGAAGRAASAAGDGSLAAITIDRYLADGSWPV
jgi:thioredoxin reductase (NADPH)